ncbi:hypothetical protein [Clostridium ljungdahlii]|uniref:Uncharacterized protein n=1 Tax=Clostridium ljungdahlii TaxID=1538 RepID=A0A166RKQ1_9CLOT|nr:hypothetical protein [Clostridium ljungdahlii]OAA90878.1 hypothetical protein WY13_00944 [Clostridium ljungdahlii]
MSVSFLKKVYINPFVDSCEPIIKIEIVQVDCIYRYTRRKKIEGKPNYEVMYKNISFDVHGTSLDDSLKKWNLSLWEYLDLLSKETEQIKKKYNFYCSDTLVLNFYYFIQDVLGENDIYLVKLMHKILSELGIPHTRVNDTAIRSVIEDRTIDKERMDSFNECIKTPYLRKK